MSFPVFCIVEVAQQIAGALFCLALSRVLEKLVLIDCSAHLSLKEKIVGCEYHLLHLC